MKLEEIRQKVADILREEIPRGEPAFSEYSQHVWESWPRVPYGELPKSLQIAVRKKATPQVIRTAISEMFGHGEFESLIQSYLAETCPKRDSESEADYKKRCDSRVTQLLIKTRNTAIYTIHGVVSYALEANKETGELEQVEVLGFDPELYGDHLMNAFEAQLWASHPQKAEEKALARQISGGARQVIISDKSYSHALVPDQNQTAFIAKMTPELLDRVRRSNGTMPIDDIGGYTTGYDDIKDLDLPLLQQIWTAAVKSGISGDGSVLTVDFGAFVREMGIDASAGSAQDVIGKINEFSGFVGVLPGSGKIQVLLTFLGYDKASNTLDLGVPYMFTIMDEVTRKNLVRGETKAGKAFEYKTPHYNRLCHSTIAKERNKAAVYLVYEITNRLLQLGDKTGKPYRVEFRTLVNAVPLLRGRVASMKTTSDKNRILKRAFTGAYKLLKTRTDAALYFDGLEYEEVVPTMSTLDSWFVAKFKGINRDYEQL